jgi:transketolase
VESAAAWSAALARGNGPTEIILSRQKVGVLPGGAVTADVARGAYVVLAEQGGAPDVVLLATGSEVGLALDAARELAKDGTRVRLVSMPCWEVFARQDAAYQAAVLPAAGIRVSVEAGRTDLWWRWLGRDGVAIGIDHFGASAPAAVLAEHFGFTPAKVAARVREALARKA